MKLYAERRIHKARLEIVPMIDVMLLMLVFYILSTLTMYHQLGIPVSLPKAQTGQSQPAPDIMVTITKNGDYYVNRTKVAPPGLADAVRAVAERQAGGLKAAQDKGVVINADLSVQHRLVVAAMDALRILDITKFGIATEPEGRAAQ